MRVGAGRVEIADARVVIDPRVEPRRPRRYGHMAIHPYPVELVTDVDARATARGCTCARSARRTRSSSARSSPALSEQTRYFRFFYQLNELTPAMLARFTQVDYDREMALVADRRSGAARRRSSASRATS